MKQSPNNSYCQQNFSFLHCRASKDVNKPHFRYSTNRTLPEETLTLLALACECILQSSLRNPEDTAWEVEKKSPWTILILCSRLLWSCEYASQWHVTLSGLCMYLWVAFEPDSHSEVSKFRKVAEPKYVYLEIMCSIN